MTGNTVLMASIVAVLVAAIWHLFRRGRRTHSKILRLRQATSALRKHYDELAEILREDAGFPGVLQDAAVTFSDAAASGDRDACRKTIAAAIDGRGTRDDGFAAALDALAAAAPALAETWRHMFWSGLIAAAFLHGEDMQADLDPVLAGRQDATIKRVMATIEAAADDFDPIYYSPSEAGEMTTG